MDKPLQDFLRLQETAAAELAANSDIFSYAPISGDPPYRYLLEFRCAGLQRVDGQIVPADHFVVGVTFGPDHLRMAPAPPKLLTWLKPETVFHPNVRWPLACTGDVRPGTGIVDLAHRLYEIASWQKFTPVEHDSLNRDACAWAREHLDAFPLDARPLRRGPAAEREVAGS